MIFGQAQLYNAHCITKVKQSGLPEKNMLDTVRSTQFSDYSPAFPRASGVHHCADLPPSMMLTILLIYDVTLTESE